MQPMREPGCPAWSRTGRVSSGLHGFAFRQFGEQRSHSVVVGLPRDPPRVRVSGSAWLTRPAPLPALLHSRFARAGTTRCPGTRSWGRPRPRIERTRPVLRTRGRACRRDRTPCTCAHDLAGPWRHAPRTSSAVTAQWTRWTPVRVVRRLRCTQWPGPRGTCPGWSATSACPTAGTTCGCRSPRPPAQACADSRLLRRPANGGTPTHHSPARLQPEQRGQRLPHPCLRRPYPAVANRSA